MALILSAVDRHLSGDNRAANSSTRKVCRKVQRETERRRKNTDTLVYLSIYLSISKLFVKSLNGGVSTPPYHSTGFDPPTAGGG